jgi:2-keto-4-pentenoate hydratase/2-oxohepta-3-ene-1,7-dioic acid hydratase in catechol pathway
MKLVRHGDRGLEHPGLIDDDGVIRDLTGVVPDINGATLVPAQLAELRQLRPQTLPIVSAGTRLGPPVTHVGKIICVGLNYHAHAEESGMEVEDEPVLFTKATSAIAGPTDLIVLPKGATKGDWEVELVTVIGQRASNVETAAALDYVAGFCLGNDVSERAFQLEGSGQWMKGKSCDTFAPIGPWLVTRDEIPDPHALDIWLEVDGVRFQNSNTRLMMFGVAEIISFISRFMSLLPGDLVFTGTPPGVGMGQNPPVWLRPGCSMRCGINGLGEQQQRVVAFEDRDS